MAWSLQDLFSQATDAVTKPFTGVGDSFKGLNIFGAEVPEQYKLMQEAGLLDDKAYKAAVEKADITGKRNAMIQGLLSFAGQDFNKGRGTIFSPAYLAKPAATIMSEAQKPYDQLAPNAINLEKFKELKAAKDLSIKKDAIVKDIASGKYGQFTKAQLDLVPHMNETQLVNLITPKEEGNPTFYTTNKPVDGVTYATQNQVMGKDSQGNAILRPIGPAYIPSESGYQGQPAAKQQIQSSAMSLYDDKIGLGFKIRDVAIASKAGSDIANIAKEISIREKISPPLAQRKAEKLFVESGAMKEKSMLSGQFNDSYDSNLFLNYFIDNYAPPKKENQSSSPKLSVGTKIIDANNIEATIEELNPDGTVKSVRTSDGKITTF